MNQDQINERTSGFRGKKRTKEMVEWVKKHPELWDKRVELSMLGKKEGMYSPKTKLGDTLHSLRRYVELAKEQRA